MDNLKRKFFVKLRDTHRDINNLTFNNIENITSKHILNVININVQNAISANVSIPIHDLYVRNTINTIL